MINFNIWISDENLMAYKISKVIQRDFRINIEEVFNNMLSDKTISKHSTREEKIEAII